MPTVCVVNRFISFYMLTYFYFITTYICYYKLYLLHCILLLNNNATFYLQHLFSIFMCKNSFRIPTTRSKKLSSVALILLHFLMCSFSLLIYLYWDIICLFFRCRTAAALNLRSNYQCCSCCNWRNINYFYTHRSTHSPFAQQKKNLKKKMKE